MLWQYRPMIAADAKNRPDVGIVYEIPAAEIGTRRARKRAVAWLTAIFWVLNVVIYSAARYGEGHPQLLALIAMRTVLAAFGVFLCYLMHLVLRKVAARSLLTRAIVLAVMAPIVADICAWASYFALTAVSPGDRITSVNWSNTISAVSGWAWFFIGWAGLYLALEYSFDVRDEAQRSAELRALAHDAKLRALYNQINPHFLFNSLNSVSALILDRRLVEAEQMVTRLSEFLRMTLKTDPTEDIRVADEVALQVTYLSIEQLRYPDLIVDVEVSPGLENAAIPTLLLQPLVENAVKYGVANSKPPARISISISRSADTLVAAIRDYGDRKRATSRADGAGIGLQNVRERLRQRFGDAQQFIAEPHPVSGFNVSIHIPLAFMS